MARRAPAGTSAVASQVSKLAHSLGKSETARAFGVSRGTINRVLRAEAQGRLSGIVTTKRGLAAWEKRVTTSKPVAREIRAERRELSAVRRETKSRAAEILKDFRPKDIAKALEETIGGKRSYQKVAADLKRIREGRGDTGLLEQLKEAQAQLKSTLPHSIRLSDGTTLQVYPSSGSLPANAEVRAHMIPADAISDYVLSMKAIPRGYFSLLEIHDEQGELLAYHLVFFGEEGANEEAPEDDSLSNYREEMEEGGNGDWE